MVKTDEQIMSAIKELPPEKKRIVAEYVEAVKDPSFKVTHYPPEVMEEIDRDAENAKQGIDVSPELEGDEAIDYLTRLTQS